MSDVFLVFIVRRSRINKSVLFAKIASTEEVEALPFLEVVVVVM